MRRADLQPDSPWHAVLLAELRAQIYPRLDIWSLRALATTCRHDYLATYVMRFERLREAPRKCYGSVADAFNNGIRHLGLLRVVAQRHLYFSEHVDSRLALFYEAYDNSMMRTWVLAHYPLRKLRPLFLRTNLWDSTVRGSVECCNMPRLKWLLETIGVQVSKRALPSVRKPKDDTGEARAAAYDYVKARIRRIKTD